MKLKLKKYMSVHLKLNWKYNYFSNSKWV